MKYSLLLLTPWARVWLGLLHNPRGLNSMLFSPGALLLRA